MHSPLHPKAGKKSSERSSTSASSTSSQLQSPNSPPPITCYSGSTVSDELESVAERIESIKHVISDEASGGITITPRCATPPTPLSSSTVLSAASSPVAAFDNQEDAKDSPRRDIDAQVERNDADKASKKEDAPSGSFYGVSSEPSTSLPAKEASSRQSHFIESVLAKDSTAPRSQIIDNNSEHKFVDPQPPFVTRVPTPPANKPLIAQPLVRTEFAPPPPPPPPQQHSANNSLSSLSQLSQSVGGCIVTNKERDRCAPRTPSSNPAVGAVSAFKGHIWNAAR